MRYRSALAALFVLLAGPALAGVDFDYDPGADFSKYRSYQWMAGQTLAEGQQASYNTTGNGLADQRIREAIEQGLKEKGLEISTEAPDLYVVFHFSTRDGQSLTSVGYGWYGGSNYSTLDYQEGTLVLDLIDTETNKTVWRGTITKVLGKPKNMEKNIQKVFEKLFKKYPPPTSE